MLKLGVNLSIPDQWKTRCPAETLILPTSGSSSQKAESMGGNQPSNTEKVVDTQAQDIQGVRQTFILPFIAPWAFHLRDEFWHRALRVLCGTFEAA